MNQKAKIGILVSFGMMAFLLYFWQDAAEAARLGGGRSFGSKPSYQRSAPATTPSPAPPQVSPNQPTQQRPLAGPTPSWGETGFNPAVEPTPAAAEQPTIPPGFDAEDFLKGAKVIYTRLQASWDKRDIEDIRQFVSPEVLAEINLQAQEDPKPGKTELLLINPSILEAREAGSQTIVSVLYDVMMRENGTETAKQVRELWHFSRETQKPEAFWLLEGIQQVE